MIQVKLVLQCMTLINLVLKEHCIIIMQDWKISSDRESRTIGKIGSKNKPKKK